MIVHVELTQEPITRPPLPAHTITSEAGAGVDFRGIVRGQEEGRTILALEYDAYVPMALHQMRRLLTELGAKHGCLAAGVIHRTGRIAVGEAAIHVQVVARHRTEAFRLMSEFMDRLKEDVPIWKIRAIPAAMQPPTQAS
jgi:molybdopterin synthase catalytic subunit